ncbi:MAG: serine/threonine protein kinase [Planctomycetaceae bacterium]|nr:serine/threonine protein kinase [Planctomycetaceae bacterium]
MKFFKKLFQRKRKLPRTDVTKRFELIGRVGQGSMSRVFRARDTRSGRIVALKILDKEKTQRFEARFSPELNKPSEGEIAVTLKHPHIVETSEWGTTLEGEMFLVMEFIEGLSLSYLVDVQNELMRSKRLRFMIQLGEAVRYFHEQGWIHRDICPRNVMLSGDNQVKLIDFGLVVPNTPPFQAPGNRTGTANYMAPELIKRQRTDQRIDVFSFAVTCYEMYTKRYPWAGAETLEMVVQHINMPPVDIRDLVPGIDDQIAMTIMKGLSGDPAKRYPQVLPMIQRFREVNAELKEVRGGSGLSTSEIQLGDLVAPPPAAPSQPRTPDKTSTESESGRPRPKKRKK